MHLNIHYFYPKFDEIKYLVDQNKELDILGFCETFLNDHFEDNEFHLQNFQMFRKDRNSHGGGILVYVKSGIPCWRRKDLESDNMETLWIEIKLKNQKSFLLCYVYRPPSSNADWNTIFEVSLEKTFLESKEIILLGDLNYNYIKETTVNNTWNSIISAHNLTQLVNIPTRVTATTSTIIDHVYTNKPSNIINVQVPELSFSDHFPVCFTRKCSLNNGKNPLHSTIRYRSYKHFNEEQFLNDLKNQPWSVLDIYDDPDDALGYFLELFLNVMNSHLPIKEKRVKHKQQPDWFNNEIIEAIRSRDNAKKQKDEMRFKYWRSRVKSLSKEAKKSFYTKTINENRKNPKLLWKNLKDLSSKSKNHDTHLINDENGEPILDSRTTAETFNEFFTNVFKSVSNSPSLLENTYEQKIVNDVKDKLSNSSFQIPEVLEDFVHKELKSLDETKSTGLDDIGPRILKLSFDVISRPITKMFNISLIKGKFPGKFKTAKVTPIFKKGSKLDKNNYRPISILPVLSKILERHVSNHMRDFLETHKLIFKMQSGFRKNHSCETALTAIIDDWIEAINDKKFVGTIFLDLTKAFDLVNHSLLLNKLRLYGFSGSSVQWFTSYLSNREQKVCVSGHLSSAQPVSAGVPQGSILGPLLFIMYINDLPLHTKDSSVDMFADDTTISAYGKTVLEVHNILQNNLNSIAEWCIQNSMIPNISKTKSMYLSASTNKTISDNLNSPALTMHGESLAYSSTEKLLGVYVDQHLNWKYQVEQTIKKCNSYLYLLLRIKSYLNLHSRKLFFNAYILPHLDYCCTIWGNCSDRLIEAVIKFQKRAARIILDKDFNSPSEELFKELRWMKFPERIKYKKAILVYKSLNNSCPEYLETKFALIQTNHYQTLRSIVNNELAVPTPRLEFSRKSLCYSGPVIWNTIPKHVRLSNTVETFKRSYLNWRYSGTT